MAKTKFTKEQGYQEHELLQFGYDHIRTALLLLEKCDPSTYDSAGYLVQLGFELLLKAWHLHKFGEFTDQHSLEALIDKLQKNKGSLQLGKDERKLIKGIEKFNKLRYPPPVSGAIPIGHEDIEKIKSLEETLWRQFPDELIRAHKAIDQTRKGGRVLMAKKKN